MSEGRGRPAEFCGPTCREADKLLGRLARHVERCAAEAQSPAALDALRSAVASALNGALNPARARLARAAKTAAATPNDSMSTPLPAVVTVTTFGGR